MAVGVDVEAHYLLAEVLEVSNKARGEAAQEGIWTANVTSGIVGNDKLHAFSKEHAALGGWGLGKPAKPHAKRARTEGGSGEEPDCARWVCVEGLNDNFRIPTYLPLADYGPGVQGDGWLPYWAVELRPPPGKDHSQCTTERAKWMTSVNLALTSMCASA